jgi:O-antigen ligase
VVHVKIEVILIFGTKINFMRISIIYLNYFYIFLVIIWAPFQSIILNFDGKGRILIFFTISVLIINLIVDSKFKRIIISNPVIWWGIWVLYSIINSVIKGYSNQNYSFSIFVMQDLLMPFVVLAVVCRAYYINSEKLLKLLTISLSIFAILGASSMSFSNGERTISELLGNKLPINCSLLILFVCLRFSRKEINIMKLVIWITFSLVIIVLSGTRKAFGASVIILGFTLFSYINFRSVRQSILVSLSLVILFVGYKFVIESTVIGVRLKDIEEQGARLNNSKIAVLNVLGDRSIQYLTGWELFNQHPFTGIGLQNYMTKTKSAYRIHSEYIVQLTECGVIGCLFFLLFYLGIAKGLFRCWKINFRKRRFTIVLIGGFIAILFINLTAWTYSFPIYFVCFGIILGFINSNKYENSHS